MENCEIEKCVCELLDRAANTLLNRESPDRETILSLSRRLEKLIDEFDHNQIMRIQDNSSKTRLSILFYGFMWNSRRISRQIIHLLEIFQDPLRLNGRPPRDRVANRESDRIAK